MSFTIKQIRYFLAVAEHGTVVTAASNVCISPSSITASIQELEKYLGVSLFTRHRRGLKLTYEGHRLVQHGHHILAAVSNAKYALEGKQNKTEGVLSLGVTVTIASYFLAPLLARFSRSFPNIKITIRENNRKSIEKKLVKGKLDIALLITSNISNNDITCKTLIRSPRRLWVPPNHKLLEHKSVSLENISKEPFIQLTLDEARSTHSQFWKNANIKPNIIFETKSVEAMRSLVATGTGVTILSDIVYRPWSLEGDRLETISLTDKIPTMDVGLAWGNPSSNEENIKAFIEFCQTEYLSGRRNYRDEILSL